MQQKLASTGRTKNVRLSVFLAFVSCAMGGSALANAGTPMPYRETMRVNVHVLPTVATFPATLLPGRVPVIRVMPFANNGAQEAWWRAYDNRRYLSIPSRRWLKTAPAAHTVRQFKASLAGSAYVVNMDCGVNIGPVCTVSYD